MQIQLFSVEEASRLARELEPSLQELVRLKREHDTVQSRIDVLSLALSGASPGNPDAQQLRRLLERRTRLGDRLRRGVEAIQSRGCVVKDLDQGLVDFYSIAGDRLIYLCWRLGEPEVAHWHPLEGGFASRQPRGLREEGDRR